MPVRTAHGSRVRVWAMLVAAFFCGLSAPARAAAGPDAADRPATWAFEPAQDRFSPDALLDLRTLNETFAGAHGSIRLSPDGGGFARGDGTPIRFWAANTSTWRCGKQEMMADHARFLAKRGVNLVRWHGNMPLQKEGSRLTDYDAAARDGLWKGVAAMKAEGIYTTISPYYPHATRLQKSWGLDSPQDNMTCLAFFDPKVQEGYKAWLRAVFEPVNPYTGIALKDEPAVAIIQIQNEDSLLFWTADAVKGGERRLLESKFGEWLVRKYGSLEAASQAWEGTSIAGDDFSHGRPALFITWELTSGALAQFGKPAPGKAARLADQSQFYVELMRGWFEEVVRYLREDIGARQLVNAGNWHTADDVLLNDLERYAYTSADVEGVNRYYTGGLHVGSNVGWAICNGDRFSNRSVLLDPGDVPPALKQVSGRPFIIPESTWVPPLGYQSEGPFLVGAFGSLSGVNAFYWFAFGGMTDTRPLWQEPTTQWVPPASANGYLPSLGKWVADTPQILGNFPAAALMYRKGYIRKGATVVRERRSLQDLWERRVPIISEAGPYDPNRDKAEYAPRSNIKQDVSRLAFLVGPVEVTYGDDPSGSVVSDVGRYINEQARIVRSNTGEVEWDYGKGICKLNAPKAQGVTGFLSKVGMFVLGDVTVEAKNDYGTVLLVSMDDKPLSSSASILVQMGTTARPTNWEERPAAWTDKSGKAQTGLEIVNVGTAPWQVVCNDVMLTVGNPGIRKAVVLDMNGMRRSETPLKREGTRLSFQMPRDAMYVVLQ